MLNLDKAFLDSISIKSGLGNLNKFKIDTFDFNSDWKVMRADWEHIVTEVSLLLSGSGLSYRIKSLDSIKLKIEKYKKQGHKSGRLCFNDLIGIRYIVDDFSDFIVPDYLKLVDLRQGKKIDDGYRAMHLYYIRANNYYPIEVQVWERRDKLFYYWLHKYCYKVASDNILLQLRQLHDAGKIQTEEDFVFRLNLVKVCMYTQSLFEEE